MDLRHVENQTIELVTQAVFADIHTFPYARVQCYDLCKYVIQREPMYLEHVIQKTLELEMLAVSTCGFAIKYVRNQLPALVEAAIFSCPHVLALIHEKEQTPEICSYAIKHRPYLIEYAVYQTELDALRAINWNPMLLKYVKNQTPLICLRAVKINGMALAHVKEQTEEICLAAVRRQGMALQYVHHQTHKICLTAVNSNGLALQFVDHPDEDIWITAVLRNYTAIRFIEDPSDDLCHIVMSINKKSRALVKKMNIERSRRSRLK